jgi:hypothetical protein
VPTAVGAFCAFDVLFSSGDCWGHYVGCAGACAAKPGDSPHQRKKEQKQHGRKHLQLPESQDKHEIDWTEEQDGHADEQYPVDQPREGGPRYQDISGQQKNEKQQAEILHVGVIAHQQSHHQIHRKGKFTWQCMRRACVPPSIPRDRDKK